MSIVYYIIQYKQLIIRFNIEGTSTLCEQDVPYAADTLAGKHSREDGHKPLHYIQCREHPCEPTTHELQPGYNHS